MPLAAVMARHITRISLFMLIVKFEAAKILYLHPT
jgi:hypothetical protein